MRTIRTNGGTSSLQLGGALLLGVAAWTAPAAEPAAPAGYRAAQSSYSIIGMDVENVSGQVLGRVHDLTIDLENGRLVDVLVVSPSGFLGLGQRFVAVPPGALSHEVAGGNIQLDMSREKFKAAPAMRPSRWNGDHQSIRLMETYRYFGAQPYFAADGQGSATGSTDTEPLGHLKPSSALLGLPIQNLSGESFGTVNAVIFDLWTAYVYHVVVLPPGHAQEKKVIQSRALRYNAARDGLLLDVSAQAFRDEPRFRWTQDGKGGFQQESFVNRSVAANDRVNTRQNVQAGDARTYTPLAQGADFRDVDKTYRIYQAMRADPGLSANARNVEVGTLNGRTTLRGHVNSEAEKLAIGRIASHAGLPENVSNLLEVRPVPAPRSQAD